MLRPLARQSWRLNFSGIFKRAFSKSTAVNMPFQVRIVVNIMYSNIHCMSNLNITVKSTQKYRILNFLKRFGQNSTFRAKALHHFPTKTSLETSNV